MRSERLAGSARPAQQRELGERLRLERARCERCRRNETAPDGGTARGVQKVMREAAVGTLPDAHVQPRRRHAASAHLERVNALPAQRVLDLDRERPQLRGDAADRDVAAAIDDEARVASQAMRDGVRGEALARAAGVKPHSGRAADHAPFVVHLDLPPALTGMCLCGAWRGSHGERVPQRCGKRTVVGVAVADRLDLRDQRRIDQSPGAARRPQSGHDGGAQQHRGRHGATRISVQRAELALGPKARESRREVLDVAALALHRLSGPGEAREQWALDDQPNVAAHRVKRGVAADAHEARVTGAASELPEELTCWAEEDCCGGALGGRCVITIRS